MINGEAYTFLEYGSEKTWGKKSTIVYLLYFLVFYPGFLFSAETAFCKLYWVKQIRTSGLEKVWC
jgi:hypothetical protein